MLTVREATDAREISAACAATGAPYESGDRVYTMTESERMRGVGLLRLRGGTVVVVGSFGDGLTAGERDLLCRSLLYACTRLAPIRLRVDGFDTYWAQFGFVAADGGWEAQNTEIVFER